MLPHFSFRSPLQNFEVLFVCFSFPMYLGFIPQTFIPFQFPSLPVSGSVFLQSNFTDGEGQLLRVNRTEL